MKPLTGKMIDVLMDCHERELQHQKPCSGAGITVQIKGLINRQLLSPSVQKNDITGRSSIIYLLTPAGKEYLQKKLLKSRDSLIRGA